MDDLKKKKRTNQENKEREPVWMTGGNKGEQT